MTLMTGIARTTDAVVFDVGGVLGARGPGANFHALLQELPGWADCPGDALNAALQAPRPDYDRGSLDDEGYWAAVAAGLGRARLNATQIAPLVAADIDHYTTWDLAAATLFTTLRQVGQRLAILSNAPRAHVAALAALPVAAGVPAVISSVTGVLKPEPRAFLLMNTKLGLTPLSDGSRIVSFDDHLPNIEAAKALGWDAHLWAGAPEAAAFLRC